MADCICREFPIGEPIEYADHTGLGVGLIRLYEVTGDTRYLDQAEYYVHNGNHGRPVDLGEGENQKPIEEQRKAWGHAVCINYLYSGATDLCRYLDEPETRTALDSLWHSIIDLNAYISMAVWVVRAPMNNLLMTGSWPLLQPTVRAVQISPRESGTTG